MDYDSALDRMAFIGDLSREKQEKTRAIGATSKEFGERRRIDQTRDVVERQLKGMPSERYEVGILRNRDTSKARMLRREWSKDQILKSLSWLKYENARGAEIFIRPKDTSWVLIDDLNQKNLNWMRQSGMKPSVVLETSPRNYQAWLKIADESIEKEAATRIAKRLARGLNGDLASADWRHLGRLAGFTNRKLEHKRSDGNHPYVGLHEHKQQNTSWGNRLLRDAKREVKELELTETISQVKARNADASRNTYPEYAEKMKLPQNKGGRVDWSRVDYRIARDMTRDGKQPEYIKSQIREHSPGLANRKGRNIEAYVDRTVKKAASSISRSMVLNKADREREKGINWKER